MLLDNEAYNYMCSHALICYEILNNHMPDECRSAYSALLCKLYLWFLETQQ